VFRQAANAARLPVGDAALFLFVEVVLRLATAGFFAAPHPVRTAPLANTPNIARTTQPDINASKARVSKAALKAS
jgi:hypothetical protein